MSEDNAGPEDLHASGRRIGGVPIFSKVKNLHSYRIALRFLAQDTPKDGLQSLDCGVVSVNLAYVYRRIHSLTR